MLLELLVQINVYNRFTINGWEREEANIIYLYSKKKQMHLLLLYYQVIRMQKNTNTQLVLK